VLTLTDHHVDDMCDEEVEIDTWSWAKLDHLEAVFLCQPE